MRPTLPRPTRHTLVLRPPLWAWAGGLLGLLLGLVVFAPAAWLALAVATATQGQVLLADARGSIWQGSAQLVLTGGQGSKDAAALPDRLGWQLRPAWQGLRLALNAPCCTPQPLRLQVQLGLGRIAVQLEDQRSVWPAALLAGLGTPWNTVQAEGELVLASQGLSVEWFEGRLVIGGNAELLAKHLSSRLSTLRPMGSYRMTLSGGTPSNLQLSTLEGALQLSGQGRWVGSRLRFEGTASAAPEREAALSNLLNIIGRRNGAQSLITLG
ncbi:MAG: type II secretion system protein N [Burkholderiaceae bacterium]